MTSHFPEFSHVIFVGFCYLEPVMETSRNTFFKSTASVASMICHKIIIAVMTWKTKAMMYEKAHVQTAKIWIALEIIHMHMLALLRYFHSSSISAASEDVWVLFGTIHILHRRTGWVGSENSHFCRRSVLYLITDSEKIVVSIERVLLYLSK